MTGKSDYSISLDDFDNELKNIRQGKKIIEEKIIEGGKQIILLFPEYNKSLCSIVYKNINSLLKNYNHITVFSTFLMPEISSYTDLETEMIIVEEEVMDSMICYASMVGLNSLKIISVNKPITQKADQLIGLKDINLEKIVVRGLFGFMEKIK